MPPKKTRAGCTGLSEPWSSALRALESYGAEVRIAPVHSVASICNKHGALIHGLTKRLPKNVTPKIFHGAKLQIMPHSAPELAQVLARNLHKPCLAEIVLAPTELRETVSQFAALVGTELAVCELAELLDEVHDPSASFVEELAVADSVERINTHLHHLNKVIDGFTAELTELYPELEALSHHATFWKQIGMTCKTSSLFMAGMLTPSDPILSPTIRLGNCGEALIAIAQKCYDKTQSLLSWCYDRDGGDGGIAKNAAPRRHGGNKVSIIGLMAQMQQNAQPGKESLLLPAEATRRKRIDAKLKKRRNRALGDAGQSSEDEASTKLEIRKAVDAHAQCAACGNIFRDDANFCPKCGVKRPPSPLAGAKEAKAQGPPSLKRFAGEDAGANDDQDFLDALRADDPARGGHDVWGARAFQPDSQEVAPQFWQKERVEDVSDDEGDTRGDMVALSPN